MEKSREKESRNIIERLTGWKLPGIFLLLTVSLSFGYTAYKQILLQVRQVSEEAGFGIFFGLTALFALFFFRMRHVLLPPEWEQSRWFQKAGVVCISLLLSLGILQSGLIPFNDLSEVTITIYASRQEKKAVTYYCTGLFDYKKHKVTSPGKIAVKADVMENVRAVNRGRGLWCKLPDMGVFFQVSWTERIPLGAFPLSLGFAAGPSSGKVTIGLNGRTKRIDLYGDKKSVVYVKLPQIFSAGFLAGFSATLFCWTVIFTVLTAAFHAACSRGLKRVSALSAAILISLPVIGFNMVHVFGPKYLLHDDPCFYVAGINRMVNWWRWTFYGSLTAFTEGFSYWMMAHYSPYVVRLLYLLLYLTGISFCIYWIARRIFNLNSVCSYLAAVLPAIYPVQHEIIAGINMSYTLIGMLVFLLSLIAGFYYLTFQRHSWALFSLAGGLYFVSTRLMEQAVFLSAALGFLFLLTGSRWKRKFLLLTPLMLAAGTVLYRMIVNPRGAAVPVALPLDVIFFRIKKFLIYLSPFQKEYGVVLVLALLAAGAASFLFRSPVSADLINRIPHFSRLSEKLQRAVLPVFVLLWTLPSAVPFIAMNRWFSVRKLHVAGYGPWLIMAPGLVFLLSFALFFLNKHLKKSIIALAAAFIIAGAGVQHMLYAKEVYKAGNYFWTSLSQAVSYHSFPEGSQIVVTDASIGTFSTIYTCTGYLARLLGNRLDIKGLIGKEFFYYDPFANNNLHFCHMTGLKNMDNLHLFRWVPAKNPENKQQNGILRPYKYFLRVVADENQRNGKEKTGDWYLYKLGSNGKAALICTGHGLAQYKKLLEELKKKGITPKQICWGNPENKYGCNSPVNQGSLGKNQHQKV